MLVVDVSFSMIATDVAPSRLEAARAAITSFADHVPSRVKVGLVAFADDPVVVTSPTTDRSLLKAGIASLAPGVRDGDRRCARPRRRAHAPVDRAGRDGRARRERAKSTGADRPPLGRHPDARRAEPDDGARLAKEAGIPVYTIALGTLTGTVTINRDGSEVVVPVPPDRATLAQHRRVDGRLDRSRSPTRSSSAAVYDRLGRVVATTSKPREVTAAFVAVAAALLAVAIGLAALSAPRLP